MMMTSRLSRSFRTPGGWRPMSLFSSEPAVSPLWCAGKTSSAGSQKVYADSPAPKVRKNLN